MIKPWNCQFMRSFPTNSFLNLIWPLKMCMPKGSNSKKEKHTEPPDPPVSGFHVFQQRVVGTVGGPVSKLHLFGSPEVFTEHLVVWWLEPFWWSLLQSHRSFFSWESWDLGFFKMGETGKTTENTKNDGKRKNPSWERKKNLLPTSPMIVPLAQL